jgi:polyisoprenoid-binding protein YceI
VALELGSTDDVKIAAIALVAAALPLFADTYTVDKEHSEAMFQIRHLVSHVSGKFEDFDGTVNLDPKNPSATTVTFHLKAASINTGVAERDEHLRSADFFDAAKYPEISFTSTSVKPSGKKDVYSVTGNLTMRGVTKQVTLPVAFMGFIKDPWGNEKAGFTLQTTLNRKDYGINWNKALDNGGVLLGDDVEVNIALEVQKVKK